MSLIEVLVAIVVLSTGLLGMVALQAKALRNNQSSLERSQAVVLTYSIIDRMHSNTPIARAGGYNYGLCAASAAADPLAVADLAAWNGNLQAALGATACGGIGCVGNVCTIQVRWDDSRGIANVAAPTTYTITTRVRI